MYQAAGWWRGGGGGAANVHLQTKHWGANVHTLAGGGEGGQCLGGIFNRGGGGGMSIYTFFIEGQMSWGANVWRSMSSCNLGFHFFYIYIFYETLQK